MSHTWGLTPDTHLGTLLSADRQLRCASPKPRHDFTPDSLLARSHPPACSGLADTLQPVSASAPALTGLLCSHRLPQGLLWRGPLAYTVYTRRQWALTPVLTHWSGPMPTAVEVPVITHRHFTGKAGHNWKHSWQVLIPDLEQETPA